jgi:putative membrane protein
MLTALQPGWCPWCGAMGWGGAFMMIFWVVVLVALGVLAWSLLQRGGRAGAPPGEDRAEEILRERFARGEIDEATYQRMLDELRR